MSEFDLRQPITGGLKDAIQVHLDKIPADKRGALIVVADINGARAHLAAKINDHWSVALEAGKPWDGPVSGQVMSYVEW
jgi:hypothetical protein